MSIATNIDNGNQQIAQVRNFKQSAVNSSITNDSCTSIDDGTPAFELFINERLKSAKDKTNRIPLDEAFAQIRANIWG